MEGGDSHHNNNDDANDQNHNVGSDQQQQLDENQIAQILVQALLPAFAKQIHLQALVAYQIDGESNRSLIVNRCFRRVDETDEQDSKNGILLQTSTPLPQKRCSPSETDSGLGESSTGIRCKREAPLSTSRRKRKFCRPCKIPQTSATAAGEIYTPPPYKIPGLEQLPITLPPILPTGDAIAPTLMNALFSAAQLEPNHQLAIIPNIMPSPTTPIINGIGVHTSMPITTATANGAGASTKLVIPLASFPTLSGIQPRPILPRPTPNVISTPLAPLQPHPDLGDSTGDGQTGTESDDSLAVPCRVAAAAGSANGAPYAANSVTSTIAELTNKSFTCNQCKLPFTSLNALCEHTYSQHKAFRCNFCGAQFTQRSNLQRHSLRHIGFKPFVCGVCQKEYYRKDHLVRHIEVTHPGTDTKKNIITKLTSAECLDYLDAITQQHNQQNTNQKQSEVCKVKPEPQTQISPLAASTEVVVPVEAANNEPMMTV